MRILQELLHNWVKGQVRSGQEEERFAGLPGVVESQTFKFATKKNPKKTKHIKVGKTSSLS